MGNKGGGSFLCASGRNNDGISGQYAEANAWW